MDLKVYCIAEMGGEGKVRAFKTLGGANEASIKCEGHVLIINTCILGIETACCVVKGASKAAPPATVFLCCQGDCGCTVSMASAHLTLAEAESAATELNAISVHSNVWEGIPSYVCECDLEP
jgi:hypothetical protein